MMEKSAVEVHGKCEQYTNLDIPYYSRAYALITVPRVNNAPHPPPPFRQILHKLLFSNAP